MNGAHDCGGMHGFGPIDRCHEDEIFHAAWEQRVFGLLWAVGAHGFWNIDEIRQAMEGMHPNHYLSIPYFEHWLSAMERLLVEKEVVTTAELAAARTRVTQEVHHVDA